MKKLSYLFVMAILMSGCATVADKYIKEHPDTPSYIQYSMRRREPCIGMIKEQVLVACGDPLQIIYDEIDGKETWVYNANYYNYDPIINYSYMSSVNDYASFENSKVVRVELEKDRKERLRKGKIEKYIQEHPERSQFKELMIGQEIKVGINKDEAELSWGELRDINRTVTAFGTSEQWVYGDSLSHGKYLYFDNGILSSWQD